MSDIIKIAVPELGLRKPREIVAKNKTVRRVWALQLQEVKLAQLQDEAMTSDEDAIKAYESVIKMLDDNEEFLVEVLKLNDKQKDALEELTQSEFARLTARVQMAIIHSEDSLAVSDEQAEPDTDPKLSDANA
ncbi:phage tail tube assembly chaperone [Secundilactobacillus kimchicus]|uniref:phage tail tube assembly chaperone n=1 Tax=Secundilactobacillus kimchicus TaxID=528209 RepID=UPI0024A95213|nr:phage tail tube assembly chaperone [Secundilactobacillus kimchicus]